MDKTLLHNDFYSNENEEKRLWFFKHFLNQRKEIQQIYYEFVNLHRIHILFFDWFEIYSSENNISYPFKESSPITIRKKIPEWKLTDSNKTIESGFIRYPIPNTKASCLQGNNVLNIIPKNMFPKPIKFIGN